MNWYIFTDFSATLITDVNHQWIYCFLIHWFTFRSYDFLLIQFRIVETITSKNESVCVYYFWKTINVRWYYSYKCSTEVSDNTLLQSIVSHTQQKIKYLCYFEIPPPPSPFGWFYIYPEKSKVFMSVFICSFPPPNRSNRSTFAFLVRHDLSYILAEIICTIDQLAESLQAIFKL